MSKKVIINKLSHLLGIEELELQFLSQLKEADLNLLQDKVVNRIEDEQSEIWEKLAKVSKFVPAFITGKIAQAVMGPSICANVSQRMDVKDSLAVLKHLSIDFLTQVSEHLIPHKNAALINAIPMKVVRKVMNRQIDRQLFYTAAGFVDVLELSKVLKLAEEIKSDNDLLAISSFVENKKCIAQIVEKLSDKRVKSLIKQAFDTDQADEIVVLLRHMDNNQLKRIIGIVNTMPTNERNNMIAYFEKKNIK